MTSSCFFQDYKKEEDPKLYKSEKSGRGPLTGDWMVRGAKQCIEECLVEVILGISLL